MIWEEGGEIRRLPASVETFANKEAHFYKYQFVLAELGHPFHVLSFEQNIYLNGHLLYLLWIPGSNQKLINRS